ncbi:hypothetical protein AV545_04055 [Paenibacillus jamilae]|uniref:hypothetical protein n=1 Tax=Paenibacillus jamilae TaxID=114136 RepID=UPI0007ABB1EB|nr:hypothetical protein [Paenibacillus jamilae]KZE65103.1 hypothetical protein AV545_04055 [Paenibacillus jamilae]
MKYGLLENGIDSLKQAYTCIEKLDVGLHEGTEHNLKDAILSLNHAIEILFKMILKNEKEYLIFSDIGKYMAAKSQMIKQGKQNVFEVGHDLKTLSLVDSVKRLELLCDIAIPDVLKGAIDDFNKTRNKLMHYELELSEEEVNTTTRNLKGFYEEAVTFLEHHIDNIEELLDKARFEYSNDEYLSDMAEHYEDMMYDEYREMMLERE